MNYLLAAMTTACLGWAEPDAESVTSAWFALYDRTAAGYEIFHDRSHDERLRLESKPLYKFNAAHVGGVTGAVYLWTRQGCAEAVGCFWGAPRPNGGSSVAHELHSLSPVVLAPRRPGPNEWHPTGKLDRKPIDGAPVPAEKPLARLSQMRSLARDFSGYTLAEDGERREMRLLTAPLYRYQSTDVAVQDGALFAFICTVGTDPEVFLVLESLPTADGPRWHYALARFGNRGLFMNYRNREIWQSVRGGDDTVAHSADNTYWLFHEPVPQSAVSGE